MKTTFNHLLRAVIACALAGLLASASNLAAQNLLANPDFSAGNTGFATDYSFSVINFGGGGEYTVTANPSSWNASLQSPPAWFDHTPTSDNLSLLINGAPTAGRDMWRQTVTVSPSTSYLLSGWVTDTYPAAGGAQGLVQFFVNGSPIGAPFAVADQTGTPVWLSFAASLNSGGASSLTVSLRDLDLTWEGNDLALDDLSMVAVPEPSSVALFALGLGWYLAVGRERLKTAMA